MEKEDSLGRLETLGRLRSIVFVVVILLVPMPLSLLGTFADGFYFYEPILAGGSPPGEDQRTEAPPPAERSEVERLRKKLLSLGPRGIYLVIDTGKSRLYVKRGQQVLLEAVCSAGSGMLLRDPDGERQWVFETPRGVFRVRRKAADPVWTKPDWAFVEEGQPAPEKWSDRIDREALGQYALYFGDGFMIHGTLYQRYLGRNITHGCIRLGDGELKRVFEMTPVGSPIYIF